MANLAPAFAGVFFVCLAARGQLRPVFFVFAGQHWVRSRAPAPAK